MRASPPKKAAVPFAFCLRAKNRRVFAGPIMIVRPMRKRIYSPARRVEVSFELVEGEKGAECRSSRDRVRCPWRACEDEKAWLVVLYVVVSKGTRRSRPGKSDSACTYMARSKNIMTPPIKKKPPPEQKATPISVAKHVYQPSCLARFVGPFQGFRIACATNRGGVLRDGGHFAGGRTLRI